MPIMPLPEAPKPVVQAPPKTKTVPTKGATVDTRYQPRADLLQHIEGKPWTVDYFQAVIGPDDELIPQQSDIAAPFQQYRCVHKYRLMVTSALNSSVNQDDQSKSMTVEGAANLFPGLIPNAGDCFLADIGDGREGVFRVTNTVRKMYLRESCFEITYVLAGYADTHNRFIEDLKRKTIQDLWWHQSFFNFGNDPKLSTSDYNDVIELDRTYYESLHHYMLEFFNVERQTLLVPGQKGESYDPFMTRFVKKMVTLEEHPYIGRIVTPSVDQHLVTRYPTVLDCLLDRSVNALVYNTHQVRLIPTRYFRHQPVLSGVYYSGVEDVVFPFKMDHIKNSYHAGKDEFIFEALKHADRAIKDLDRLLGKMDLDGLYWKHVTEHMSSIGVDKLEDIVPVTADDFYIFTGHFYGNRVPTSKFEHVVLQLLKNESLNNGLVLYLLKASSHWLPLERFYYVPVLWCLARAALRGG